MTNVQPVDGYGGRDVQNRKIWRKVRGASVGLDSRKYSVGISYQKSENGCKVIAKEPDPADRTVSEYANRRINMRENEILISAESDASAWSLGLARWRRRSTRGGCQVPPGYMAGRSGSPARPEVTVVLAWQVTRCAICLRCAGIGCRPIVPGPCRGF